MNWRKIIRTMINTALRPLNLEVRAIPSQALSTSDLASKVSQTQLFFHYSLLRNLKLPLPKFEDTGFRVYSQNDEDGLLLYLFALIGTTNKVCVDVGFGSPHGANTTNLICNWGWTGLLIEGNENAVRQTKQFLRHTKIPGYIRQQRS